MADDIKGSAAEPGSAQGDARRREADKRQSAHETLTDAVRNQDRIRRNLGDMAR